MKERIKRTLTQDLLYELPKLERAVCFTAKLYAVVEKNSMVRK